MKTNQLMKREFMDSQITQRTKDTFFNATELLAIYNANSKTKKVFAEFWSNKNTKEFIDELENELLLNIGNSLHFNNPIKSWESTRGKGGGTWMHPYLFVKFAMWLSPKFELQIIKWVYDNLIETRNQAGDYYKEMCDTIMNRYVSIKGHKPDPLIYMKEAKYLNILCYGTGKPNKRNELTELELKLMNDLQKLNIMFINDESMDKYTRKQKLKEYSRNFKAINF